MKILVGGPARQNGDIFKEHLKAINNLELPKGAKLDKFYIINDCPELKQYLGENEYIEVNTEDKYITDETTHHWTISNMDKMCVLRNMFIECAKSYDYAFFIDSDVIVKPETLKFLLAAKKDIIAEIFWTRQEDGRYWCNCWQYDQYTNSLEAYRTWLSVEGIHKVGGTGACMLISRRVIEAGVNYSRIPCLKDVLVGEDRWFMIRAACAGFEMFIDNHCPADHLYRMSEYQKFIEERRAERGITE